MTLIELATLFRTINLYAHHAHNLTKGQTFFEDHAFFNDLYDKADEFYDDLIERHIGTQDDNVDLNEIMKVASSILIGLKSNFFQECLIMLEHAIKEIDKMVKSNKFSQGTVNLLQGQADQVEVLIYKIKRKLK